MSGLEKLGEYETAHIRVRLGALTAYCPRCEAAEFLVTASDVVLVCCTCGVEVDRAALLEQLATAARLTANALDQEAHEARQEPD